MDSAVQQYHDELFSRHRAPDITGRTNQIKDRTSQVVRELEDELKNLTQQRVFEIRNLSSTIGAHQKELHQAVQTFKQHSIGIQGQIANDRDEINARIQKFRNECEERKRRMAESSRLRHQQLEVEIGQLVDSARKELTKNSFSNNGGNLSIGLTLGQQNQQSLLRF
jgi:hypothetical protein